MSAHVARQPDPEIEDAELVEPAANGPSRRPPSEAERQALDANLTLPLGGAETPSVPATAPSTALEPATLTGEYITREARLQILEHEAVSIRNGYARLRVHYGQVLREYRDLCHSEGSRFNALLERLGITRAVAYRHIQVADLCDRFPQLESKADDSFSKLVVICQEADEQEIELIAAGASALLPADDFDRMTVGQMKARLRAQKADLEKQLERRTAVMRKERDELIAERDRLAAIASDTLEGVRKTVSSLEGQLLDVTKSLTGLYRQLDALPADAVQTPGARLLLEQINGVVGRLARAGDELWIHWRERAYQDWGYEDVPVNELPADPPEE